MILNGVIDGAEVQRTPGVPPSGQVSIDVRFLDIRQIEQNVEASFIYEVDYKEDAGFLRMSGRLLIQPPDKQSLELLLDNWSKEKKLPLAFMQDAINATHNLCTMNSPFATRIVDLAPPIMPMNIQLKENAMPSRHPQFPQRPKKK